MFRPTEIGKLLKYIIFHVNGRNITLIPRHVSKIRRNTSLKFLMLLKGGGKFSNIRHLLLVPSIILAIVYEVNIVILFYFSRN